MFLALDLSTLQEMQFYADIATIIAVVVAVTTFVLVRRGSKETEQILIVRELRKEIQTLENEISRDNYNGDKEGDDLIRSRLSQMMNIYEWFAFLVSNRKIKDKKLLRYMRTPFLTNYIHMLQETPELLSDERGDIFEEAKTLYEKWK